MKNVIILLMLAFSSAGYATVQECDVIWIGEKSYLTPVYPLESCSDYQTGEHAFTTSDSDNTRGYVAVWEIREKKLYLIFIARSGTSLDLSGDRNYAEPARKRINSHTWATLESLFPKRIKHGKVFADWFSGTIFYPGFAWDKTLSPEEHKKFEAGASVVVSVDKGVVTKIERRERNSSNNSP